MPAHAPSIVFIGGGPRTAGLLERLAANRPELFDGPLRIHVVEPYQPGSGRIWRFGQDPGLMLNSTAGDVTMFSDSSVQCSGPAVEGPTLAEWAAGVTGGSIVDIPELPAALAEQARTLTPASFPTRQLHSRYLEWFFRRAVARLGHGATVTVHRGTAVDVAPLGTSSSPGARHLVRLASGATLPADAVVLATGHTDALPDDASAAYAAFAARHGGFHAAPSYTTDVDYSPLAAGADVIVAGMGLAFVDLVVLLMEGRGGRFADDGDGRLRYLPSGAEPHLWAGSRRGVPYHSKISASLRGDTGAPLFFAGEAVAALLAGGGELDFRSQLWPLVAKDVGYAYYRELFTGSPERTALAWEEFSLRFTAADWYSQERQDLVAGAVPDAALRLDFEELDQPLGRQQFRDHDEIQAAVAGHIEHDLALRTGGDNPETLALFLALLRAYMDLGTLVPAGRLNAASRDTVHGWWHGFFSFVDSGPPPHRLRQLLAVHRAGLLHFLGPGLDVGTDDETGEFVATSAQTGSAVRARAFIEARLPAPTVVRSTNPVLRALHRRGLGTEQQLPSSGGTASTGRLLVTDAHQLVGPDGGAHTTVFAVGPGTSGWGAGAFARPRTNAAPFRENDALARQLLIAAASASVPVDSPASAEVAPQATPPVLDVLELPMDDPRVRPLLDELAVEYDTRYGDLFGPGSAAEELNRYPAHEFVAPHGALLILQENGRSVAGGAFRRHGTDTAEFKRIWTHSAHRRRGLARRVLAELESTAAARGYSRVFLTTGPRQPEAKHLYLTTGYQPQFDIAADPETVKSLAFTKELTTR